MTFEKVPAEQLVHILEALSELKLPTGQREQLDLPVVFPNDPGGQLRHTVDPDDAVKVPAAHAVQAEIAFDPEILLKVPAGHAVQELEPELLLKLPGEQARQEPDPSRLY